MVAFLSSWVKNLSLAVVVISILEMLLPNNKTKKYIKMIMGLYILFSIISPFIQNDNMFDFENIDFSTYLSKSEAVSTQEVNQNSMDKRLNEIYEEELKKDVTEKIENQGYIVEECKIDAYVSQTNNDTGISKITLKVSKKEAKENNTDIENKLVSEIQKIQKVQITSKENKTEEKDEKSNISKTDIENIKNFLINEYGVSKSCLKIN